MNILALDLGTKTGWALLEGSRMESGVQDFSKGGESNGMLFLKFNRWLSDITDRSVWVNSAGHVGYGFCPLLIAYEAPHHRAGGAATEIAVGLATRIQEACALRNLECTPVHSMTLKKWATGRAGKDAMIRAACKFRYGKEWGWWAEAMPLMMDDNEADAICLLGYTLEKFGEETTCNARPAAALGITTEARGPMNPFTK